MYHFRSAIVAVRMRESRRIETAWGAYAHDLSKKKRGDFDVQVELEETSSPGYSDAGGI